MQNAIRIEESSRKFEEIINTIPEKDMHSEDQDGIIETNDPSLRNEEQDSSIEDETETFDEDSLEYSDEDQSEDEFDLNELEDEESVSEQENAANAVGDNEDQSDIDKETYNQKLNEMKMEIQNLKDMINDFTKSIKSELTEIIFDQFSFLEKELEPKN